MIQKQVLTIVPYAQNESWYALDIQCRNWNDVIQTHRIAYKSDSTVTDSGICDFFREYIKRFELPIACKGTITLIIEPLFGENILAISHNELLSVICIIPPVSAPA